jgi:hypothetical protein
MRIELPTASWTDTLHRAEDDAHTLTVAVLPALDWFAGAWSYECDRTHCIEVARAEPAPVTLTF